MIIDERKVESGIDMMSGEFNVMVIWILYYVMIGF